MHSWWTYCRLPVHLHGSIKLLSVLAEDIWQILHRSPSSSSESSKSKLNRKEYQQILWHISHNFLLTSISALKQFSNLQGLKNKFLWGQKWARRQQFWVTFSSDQGFNIKVTENPFTLSQAHLITSQHTDLPLFNFLQSFWISWRWYFGFVTFLSIRLTPARRNNIYSYHKIVRETAS